MTPALGLAMMTAPITGPQLLGSRALSLPARSATTSAAANLAQQTLQQSAASNTTGNAENRAPGRVAQFLSKGSQTLGQIGTQITTLARQALHQIRRLGAALTPTRVSNTNAARPTTQVAGPKLSATQEKIMTAILPSIDQATSSAFKVADIPWGMATSQERADYLSQRPANAQNQANPRYCHRASIGVTDKPNQSALTKLQSEARAEAAETGVRVNMKEVAKNALQSKSYWKHAADTIKKTDLHSIKCLLGASIMGEAIKGPAAQAGLHVYQIGAKAFDHHLVMVTPEPLNIEPGGKIQPDQLPQDTVFVDMWQHYISLDKDVEVVEGQRGTFGQEVVRYSNNSNFKRPTSNQEFIKTGMLATLDQGHYITTAKPTEVTVFTELTDWV